MGQSQVASGAYDAFVYYGSGSMVDLNSLIPTTSGWTLERATGINDSGQICGFGINPSGQTEAFPLNPSVTPEPSTFSLLAVGGISLAAYALPKRRRKRSLSLADETDSQKGGPAILFLPSRWKEAARRAA